MLNEFYVFRSGGHSLAKQLKARRLSWIESTPEEGAALKIAEKLANTFDLDVPSLYVLPDEIGVNALTAGFHPKDTVIILTWGRYKIWMNLSCMVCLGMSLIRFCPVRPPKIPV